MFNKGSIPMYVMAGASLILSLVGFIFINTTSTQSADIKDLQDTATVQAAATAAVDSRTSALEAHYQDIDTNVQNINKSIQQIDLKLK